MIPALVGMTVARSIPTATLAGLAMGRYVLHGGVVRWTVGTPAAGQIVAHLLPAAGMSSPLLAGAGIITSATSTLAATTAATAATTAATAATIGAVISGIGAVGAVVGASFGIANFFQSKKILKAVQQTMQVAELNLAVTRASFAELDQRLIRLEITLREVKQTLSVIQHLLENTHRAELMAALEHLRMCVKPWYYHRSTDGEPTEARRFNTVAACEYRLAHDQERVIPALNKLVTRNAVLSGYEGQYALMEHLRMTPGELEASIQAKAPAATGDDDSMLVLMMAEAAG